jgi:hypothetical protein
VILGAAFVTGYGFGWARLRSAHGEAIGAGGTEKSDEVPGEMPQTPTLAHE